MPVRRCPVWHSGLTAIENQRCSHDQQWQDQDQDQDHSSQDQDQDWHWQDQDHDCQFKPK